MCEESRGPHSDYAGRVAVISDVKQSFLGLRYYRCGGENGYFRRSANAGEKILHRVVWIYYHGAIPDKFDVHHVDGNRANNQIENLRLLSRREHHRLHNRNASPELMEYRKKHMEEIRPLASEWHRSPEGRAWHRLHAAKKKKQNYHKICQHCGREFDAVYEYTLFCSKACKAAARRASGVDGETRCCVICGEPFTVSRYSRAACCSRKCGAVLACRNRENRKRLLSDSSK